MTLMIDIVFGSKSDAPIYERLEGVLVDCGVDTRVTVCSAHRNPDQLREMVKASKADLFVAGAGLSAHLPGAIAAHSLKPVIGLPCNDVLHGFDALIASMQMPSGVPVLAVGVENITAIEAFVRFYQTHHAALGVSVLSPPSAQKWVDAFWQYHASLPKEMIPCHDQPKPNTLAVQFVDVLHPAQFELQQPTALCIPYLSEGPADWDPRTLMKLTAQGGLWVGLNTYKNALLGIVQLVNANRQWDDVLVQQRGGTPAYV